MIQVGELSGVKSLHALRVYSQSMIGLSFVPPYAYEEKDEFFSRVEKMSEAEREKIFLEACTLVRLNEEDVEETVCFCRDKNGVPYTKENIKNLKPDELVQIIVSVFRELYKFKVNLVTENEKKKSVDFQ